jgi:polyisoprenoid-binding protein YceI
MTSRTKWSIDQTHSEIAFSVQHLMIAHVKGSFKKFNGTIYTTGKDFTRAEIDLWIDPSSITTGNDERDEHLRNADFFDTKKYNEITFKANGIGLEDIKSKRELKGTLTMKGVTKEIKLNTQFGGIAKDSFGNEKAGFTISGTIKRSDWGLMWNTSTETGGALVSDEVKIICEVELINASQKELSMKLESSSTKNGSH